MTIKNTWAVVNILIQTNFSISWLFYWVKSVSFQRLMHWCRRQSSGEQNVKRIRYVRFRTAMKAEFTLELSSLNDYRPRKEVFEKCMNICLRTDSEAWIRSWDIKTGWLVSEQWNFVTSMIYFKYSTCSHLDSPVKNNLNWLNNVNQWRSYCLNVL